MARTNKITAPVTKPSLKDRTMLSIGRTAARRQTDAEVAFDLVAAGYEFQRANETADARIEAAKAWLMAQ